MTDRQDPEIIALASVLRALEPLTRDQQKRVLTYAGDRLSSDLSFNTTELLGACAEAFRAINEAANQLSGDGSVPISGAQLIDIVTRMYREAAESLQGPTTEETHP